MGDRVKTVPQETTSTSRFSFSRKFFLLSSPTCSFWPSFKKSLSLNVGRSLACNKKPVSNSQNPYFLGEGWYTDPLVVFWLHRDSDWMWGCTRTFCLFIRWSGSSCPLSMKMASGRAQYLSMNPCAELCLGGNWRETQRATQTLKTARKMCCRLKAWQLGSSQRWSNQLPEQKCILLASDWRGRGDGLKKNAPLPKGLRKKLKPLLFEQSACSRPSGFLMDTEEHTTPLCSWEWNYFVLTMTYEHVVANMNGLRQTA